MTEYFNVGKIVNTQGLKGEVRVISTTDFAEERYKKGQTLYLFQDKKEPLTLQIRSHRKHKNFDIISFDNHPSINDVEKYRDGILKVTGEDLQDLGDHEYYYYEIIGLSVMNEKQEILGKVKEILSLGANDVWVVQQPQGKDILLPYIDSVIGEIDLVEGIVHVEIPEGLIDDAN